MEGLSQKIDNHLGLGQPPSRRKIEWTGSTFDRRSLDDCVEIQVEVYLDAHVVRPKEIGPCGRSRRRGWSREIVQGFVDEGRARYNICEQDRIADRGAQINGLTQHR